MTGRGIATDLARAAPVEPGRRVTQRVGSIMGRLAVVVVVAATLTLMAACGPTSSGTPPASGAAGSPGPTGAVGELPSGGPQQTFWPYVVPRAVVALGGMDSQITAGASDLGSAISDENLAAMRGAADGIVKLIDAGKPSVDALKTFADTEQLGRDYEAAFAQIREGAVGIRDAISKGDAAGITSGFRTFSAGMSAYSTVREPLSTLVPEALRQIRALGE